MSCDTEAALRARIDVLQQLLDRAHAERDAAIKERDIARADAHGCRKAWQALLSHLDTRKT